MFPTLFKFLNKPANFKHSTAASLIIGQKYQTQYSTLEKAKRSIQFKPLRDNFELTIALSEIKKDNDFKRLIEHFGGTSSVVETLQSINNGSESAEKLQNLPQELADEIVNISNKEIVCLLEEMKNIMNHEDIFLEMWQIIDKEALKRIPTGDPSDILAICFKLAELNLAFLSDWVWSALKRFCRNLERLNKTQMLQVMFLVQICRKFPSQYSAFDIQFNLVNHFDHLSLREMSVVASAFFKSETKLSNSVIMSKIMKKLINDTESCDSYSLSTLSKIIRYSIPLTLSDELYFLQAKLADYVHLFEFTTLTHLALSGTSVLVYNKELIDNIKNRIKGNVSQIRLKDIERILLVLSLYNVRDDEFIVEILDDLKKREAEIQSFPKSLISIVQYMAIQEYFVYPLIDRVLSEKYLNETYGKLGKSYRKIGVELIYIDKSVEIERPDYTGARLPDQMLKTSAKVATFSQNAKSGTQKFSYELENALGSYYGGKEHVTYSTILPQYHYPDFIIGFDDRLTPQKIPEDWRVHHWGDIKRLPDNRNIWLVVVVGGWNMVIRNTLAPLGTLNSKLRQLRILGFHPVLISYTIWRQCTDKESYLKGRIDEELKKIQLERSKGQIK